MSTTEPKLCDHPYGEMVWRISCHDDLLSPACRNASQRSAMCCNRPACLARVSRWVDGAGHGVVRSASRRAVTA